MRRLRDFVERVPPAAWLVLAFALRAGLALALGGRFYQVDESGFDGAAWAFGHSGFAGLAGQAPPLVPTLFFGSFYALFGHHPLPPRLGQAAIGTLVAWMIGRMTEDLSGSRRAGRWALALSSFYPFFVYYCGMMMSETLYVAAIVPGFWMLGMSLKEPDGPPRRPALAGLFLGLAALTRTEAAPILAVIWAFGALACLLRRWSWKGWALAVVCWLLPLSTAALRNYESTGRLTLDNHGGVTMLIGTQYYEMMEATDTGASFQALRSSPLWAEARKLDAAEQDRLFFRAALAFMKANPRRTLVQWGRKLVSFWRFYPRTDKIYIETPGVSRPGLGLKRWLLVLVSLAFEPALILLGLAGLWRLRKGPQVWPIGLFILGTTGVHMLVVSMMRYRLPVMPFLMLGACALLFPAEAGELQQHERAGARQAHPA